MKSPHEKALSGSYEGSHTHVMDVLRKSARGDKSPTAKSVKRHFSGDTRSASHRRRQDRAYNRVMGLD